MTVVLCPKCREQVSLPLGTSPETRVRCPLCREEYALQQAVRQLPPCLEIVEPRAGTIEATRTDDANSPVSWDAPFSLPPSAEDVPSAPAVAHSEPPVPRFELEAAAARVPRVPTSRPRSRRKTNSPLRAIIQIVGGGMLGLLIAQLVLWWMPGNWHASNRDPLELAGHVAPYLPFVVPDSLRPDTGLALGDGPDTHSSLDSADSTPEPVSPSEDASADSSEGVPAPFSEKAPPTDATPVSSSMTELSSTPDRHRPAIDSPVTHSGATTAAGGHLATAQGTSPIRAFTSAAAEVPARLDAWHAASGASLDKKRQAIIALFHELARLGAAAAGQGVTDGSAAPPELALALRQIAQEPLTPTYLAQFAARWIDDPARSHSGIAVFGTITAVQHRGDRIASQLQLATEDQRPIVVLSDEPLAATPVDGHQVLVLGRLTADGSAIDLGLAIPVRR
ncbi:MAG: hypothetical protein AB7F89_05050 [Pirellulaceae bacterium]